jgi:hypothetical protein
MVSRTNEAARTGFLVLDEIVGERQPTLRRRRTAEGTSPGLAADGGARALRVRLVELLACDVDPTARAGAARQIAALGTPLPAGVLRALASLARDRDPRVRGATATTLVRLLEAIDPLERCGLVGRLATSTRAELRLLVAVALRHGALLVGGLTALEHLIEDPDPDVARAAWVSARLRLADAPARLRPIVQRARQRIG